MVSGLAHLTNTPSPPLRSPCLNIDLARSKGGFDADSDSCFGSPSSSEAGSSLGGVKELQIFPMMTMATTRPKGDGVGNFLTVGSTSSDEDTETPWVQANGAPGWTTPRSGSSKRNKNSSTKNDNEDDDDGDDEDDDNSNSCNDDNPSKPVGHRL